MQTDRGANGHSDVDRRARLALNLLLKKKKKEKKKTDPKLLAFPTTLLSDPLFKSIHSPPFPLVLPQLQLAYSD